MTWDLRTVLKAEKNQYFLKLKRDNRIKNKKLKSDTTSLVSGCTNISNPDSIIRQANLDLDVDDISVAPSDSCSNFSALDTREDLLFQRVAPIL